MVIGRIFKDRDDLVVMKENKPINEGITGRI